MRGNTAHKNWIGLSYFDRHAVSTLYPKRDKIIYLPKENSMQTYSVNVYWTPAFYCGKTVNLKIYRNGTLVENLYNLPNNGRYIYQINEDDSRMKIVIWSSQNLVRDEVNFYTYSD